MRSIASGARRKMPRHLLRRFQVPLRIGFEQPPGLVDRDVLADAGHDVLQGPPLGHVIEHVVHGDQRNEGCLGDRLETREPAVVVAAIEHAGGEPDGLAE